MTKTQKRSIVPFSFADKRFFRFILIGFLNSIFGYGVFYAFLQTGMPPELAVLLATIAGVLFNFMTTSRLVFRSDNWRAICPFIATYAFVYAVNALALRFMISVGVSAALAQAFLMLPCAVLTFLILRNLVFAVGSHKPSTESK